MQRRPSSTAMPDRRERLLHSAQKLFARQPYDDVSINAIAGDASVAHGLAFHYFGSKLGLYLAVLERESADRRSEWERNTETDPAAWLRIELDTLLRQAARERQRFINRARNSAGAEVGVIITRERQEMATRLIRKLAPRRESNQLRLAVAAWVAYANELVASWVESRDRAREPVVHVLVDVLTASLSAVAQSERTPSFDPLTFASAPQQPA